MVGLAMRPFAASSTPPPALEWLLLRGHIGRGNRAPSLLQMYGSQTYFDDVDFFGSTVFVPQQVSGNQQPRFREVHDDQRRTAVGLRRHSRRRRLLDHADQGSDRRRQPKTLAHDCEAQYSMTTSGDCHEVVLLTGSRILDHLESAFRQRRGRRHQRRRRRRQLYAGHEAARPGRLRHVRARRQGTFINSYLIKSPRALREYYRTGAAVTRSSTPTARATTAA